MSDDDFGLVLRTLHGWLGDSVNVEIRYSEDTMAQMWGALLKAEEATEESELAGSEGSMWCRVGEAAEFVLDPMLYSGHEWVGTDSLWVRLGDDVAVLVERSESEAG